MSDNPLEDLLRHIRDCSEGSMESVLLKQMELVAELKKQMKRDFDTLVEISVRAEITSLLLHDPQALREAADRRQKVFRFEETREMLPQPPERAAERIPARRGRPAARYRTKDVA